MSGPESCSADRESVLCMANIYTKETNGPLSNYQKQINVEAGLLALSNPALLC